MNILILEDSNKKLQSIIEFLTVENNISQNCIQTAKNIVEFTAKINSNPDIIIIDLKVPLYGDQEPTSTGNFVLGLLEENNITSSLLVVSSYPEEFESLRESFEKKGCILADFKSNNWQHTLQSLIVLTNKNEKYDFLIFCGLHEEVLPYRFLDNSGKNTSKNAKDAASIDIITLGDTVGAVVLLPSVGLVTAAAVSAKYIDKYNPKIVAMSGICGGIDGSSDIGQLLIAELFYEYQSGKHTVDSFEPEPYQVSVNIQALAILKAICLEVSLDILEEGYDGPKPTPRISPKSTVYSSGSSVITNSSLVDNLKQTHRKLGAIDMESYAIARAAELSSSNPIFICAKSVSDLCNPNKNDHFHRYNSHISAKFITLAIKRIINEMF